MTALVAAFALTPLLLAGDQPGKEILHPVAIVIFGGLVSSTLLDTLLTPVLFWLVMSGTIAKIVFMLAFALALGTAHGHGDAPAKHGGMIKVANDITFELVVKQDVGRTVSRGSRRGGRYRGHARQADGSEWNRKTEVDLKPAGGNRLEARGVKIDPGAKVIAAVSSADGKSTMSARFAIARSTTP